MVDRLRGEPVRILAHRGLALDTDENSLSAFRAAADLGIQWIETDVNTTSDGVVMAIHDPDLERVAGIGDYVTAMDSEDLAKIRLRAGEHIPTMASALERFPELRFNVDIKDEASVLALPQVVSRTAAWDRVLIASFSESRRRRALRHVPDGVPSSAGYTGIAVFRLVSALMPLKVCAKFWPWVRRAISPWVARFEVVQIPVSQKIGPFRIPVAEPRFVEAAHACGLRVDVWTIDDPEEMKRLVTLGVDGIVTNRADVAMDVVAGI